MGQQHQQTESDNTGNASNISDGTISAATAVVEIPCVAAAPMDVPAAEDSSEIATAATATATPAVGDEAADLQGNTPQKKRRRSSKGTSVVDQNVEEPALLRRPEVRQQNGNDVENALVTEGMELRLPKEKKHKK